MRKKIKLLFLLLTLIVSTPSIAQILHEDFSTPPLWPILGNTVMNNGAFHSAPGTMLISNGKLELRGLKGQQSTRYKRDIGSVLANTDEWRLEFDLKPTSISQNDEAFFALTDNINGHWLAHDLPTYLGPGGNGEPLYERYKTTVNSILIKYFYDATTSNLRLDVRTKVGQYIDDISNPITISQNSTSYVRLERDEANRVLLSVFSNPGRTTHVLGSPVCLMIDDQLGDFRSFQAAVGPLSATNKKADLDLDNVKIYDNVIDPLKTDNSTSSTVLFTPLTTSVVGGCPINFPPNVDQYEFSFIGDIQPGHNFIKSILDYGDNSHNTFDGLASNSSTPMVHVYNFSPAAPPVTVDPAVTIFYYYWNGDKYIMQTSKDWINPFVPISTCFNAQNPAIQNNSVSNGCSSTAILTYTINQNSGTVTYNNVSPSNTEHLISFIDFGDCTQPERLDPGHSVTHTYNQSHTYEATLTVYSYKYVQGYFDVCEDEMNQNVIINLPGIPRLKSPNSGLVNKNKSFDLHPNPVSNKLTVNLTKGINRVKILGITGNVIIDKEFTSESKSIIDMSTLPNGVYIVSVQNGEKVETQKVIKQ